MASTVESGGVVVEKPGWSVYTTMLLISMLALILGCICLYVEMESYHWDMKAKKARAESTWQQPAVELVISPETNQAIV